MDLTDIAIKKLQPKEKAYKVYDNSGTGLYVWVKTNGGKYFKQKYTFQKRPYDIQIGSVSKAKCRLKSDCKPDISLDKIRVLITFEYLTEEREVESYTCPATEEVFEYLDAEHLRLLRVIRYSDIILEKFYENHFVRSKNKTTWETHLRNYKECYETVEVLYDVSTV